MAHASITPGADTSDVNLRPDRNPRPVPTFDGLPPEVRAKIFKWCFSGETVALTLFKPRTMEHCSLCEDTRKALRNFVSRPAEMLKEMNKWMQECKCCNPRQPSTLHNILLTYRKYHMEALPVYLDTVKLFISKCCSKNIGIGAESQSQNWRDFRDVAIEPEHLDTFGQEPEFWATSTEEIHRREISIYNFDHT